MRIREPERYEDDQHRKPGSTCYHGSDEGKLTCRQILAGITLPP